MIDPETNHGIDPPTKSKFDTDLEELEVELKEALKVAKKTQSSIVYAELAKRSDDILKIKDKHKMFTELNDFLNYVDGRELENNIIFGVTLFTVFAVTPFFMMDASDPNSAAAKLIASIKFNDPWKFFEGNPLYLTVIGFLIGLLLFYFRGHKPKLYGVAEIGVGIATVANAAVSMNEENGTFLQFLAGVYVIIRGLDNFAKNLDTDRRMGRLFSQVFRNPR
ncbi:hypothetical protein [Rhizobium sp. Leaf383]|uniref:hypothetical protein n=1 Tax=Rhizobium sp. Leaf383 TaxID=1736357 RepID=UPI00071566A2|nr:hypothetical protein [Rhizobium sp. Leaf383]KQS84292.1 hypothetical protein ASG58_21215 [Rhizobium sp. Leaf383]